MEKEQEVPAQEAPQSPASSLLSSIVNQKEHDLVDLMKTRTVEYVFTGIYDDAAFPKACKIRRWSYGASIDLLPETVGVIGEVIGLFSSLSGKRTVDMEINGIVDDIFALIAAPERITTYSSVLSRIGLIVQKTLDGTAGQKIEAKELELVDIIGISKIILNQNLGVILKNVKTAPKSAEPVKENAQQ